MSLPIFLETYQPFENLAEWRRAWHPLAQARNWELQSFGSGFVLCRLRWNKGEIEAVKVERVATDAREAVFKVLEEFDK